MRELTPQVKSAIKNYALDKIKSISLDGKADRDAVNDYAAMLENLWINEEWELPSESN